MNNIIHQIKAEILELNQKYIDESDDHYDFWAQHIKLVVENALRLAEEYHADTEIVELGAILHDVALVSKTGSKKDHHINGAVLAKELLSKYKYPKDRSELVADCVLNHRSGKYANNIEELCVADADILAHFGNMNMIVNNAKRSNATADEVVARCRRDFEDLSEKTKENFKAKYDRFVIELIKRLEDEQ